jgi:predicted RNase H-like HicB family nuclease
MRESVSSTAKTYAMEIIFEIRDAEEGGYWARALGHAIFTQGDTWDELRTNVLEATSLHFEDGPLHPRLVQLHYVKDELVPVTAPLQIVSS